MKNKLGFTLVEMAVVLVIFGLLIASFLTPLTAQIEQTRNAEARKDLQEIKEILLGYVVVNFKLPCPDINGDGVDDSCPNTNITNFTSGDIPWADLGLKSKDPWGHSYKYAVNNAFSDNFLLSTQGSGAGDIKICTDATCSSTLASKLPVLIFSLGKNGAVIPPLSSDEKENTDGDSNFVSHDFSSGVNEFDDILIWIPTNLIMNRMVMAGKLP